MILLDTHVVVWLAQDYHRISPRGRSAIKHSREKGRGLAVSCITLIELAQLSSFGRISLEPDAETVLAEIERRFVIFPITSSIALQAYALPARYPKDPADRIIGATALLENIPLVTSDRNIRASRAIPTIW